MGDSAYCIAREAEPVNRVRLSSSNQPPRALRGMCDAICMSPNLVVEKAGRSDH